MLFPRQATRYLTSWRAEGDSFPPLQHRTSSPGRHSGLLSPLLPAVRRIFSRLPGLSLQKATLCLDQPSSDIGQDALLAQRAGEKPQDPLIQENEGIVAETVFLELVARGILADREDVVEPED